MTKKAEDMMALNMFACVYALAILGLIIAMTNPNVVGSVNRFEPLAHMMK